MQQENIDDTPGSWAETIISVISMTGGYSVMSGQDEIDRLFGIKLEYGETGVVCLPWRRAGRRISLGSFDGASMGNRLVLTNAGLILLATTYPNLFRRYLFVFEQNA